MIRFKINRVRLLTATKIISTHDLFIYLWTIGYCCGDEISCNVRVLIKKIWVI